MAASPILSGHVLPQASASGLAPAEYGATLPDENAPRPCDVGYDTCVGPDREVAARRTQFRCIGCQRARSASIAAQVPAELAIADRRELCLTSNANEATGYENIVTSREIPAILPSRAERELGISRDNLRIAVESGNAASIAHWAAYVDQQTARAAKVLALYADLAEADSPQAEIIRRRLHELGEDVYAPVYTAPAAVQVWTTCEECGNRVRNNARVYHTRECSQRRSA